MGRTDSNTLDSYPREKTYQERKARHLKAVFKEAARAIPGFARAGTRPGNIIS